MKRAARKGRSATATRNRHWLTRRRALGLALLLTAVALLLFGRTSYALWAKQAAVQRLQSGELSVACQYLRRAAWVAPGDGAIDLMRAFCYRHLRQIDHWRESLQAAEEKGTPAAPLARERQLYQIQAGELQPNVESQLAALGGEGFTAYDAPAAFVAGCLAAGRTNVARQILDAWSVTSPQDAHVAWITGKYWEALGDVRKSREQYETALTLEPRHELACTALAELLEQDDQLESALRRYTELGRASPTSEVAAVGAARIRRKMGELEQAQAGMVPFSRTRVPSAEVAAELGRTALDSGDLPAAEQWFARAGLETTRDPLLMMSAVCLSGLKGDSGEAERFFQRITAIGNPATRMGDVRIRLTVDPGDAAAVAEKDRLLQELNEVLVRQGSVFAKSPPKESDTTEGQRLFALHCAACHGDGGSGHGRAARHLFPPPRDLRREPSRLVSTRNGLPTLDDTVGMLRRGIPGTSMSANDQLDDRALRLLAEEVHRLRREGLREQLASQWQRDEEIPNEQDLAADVERLVTPDEVIPVPNIGPTDPSSVARGSAVFRQQGCASCHGEDGAGVADQVWYDERGFPVRTRDLGRELLKGGQDANSLYLRIAAGMPGTVHPSSRGLSQESLVDLVQFCRSLSREPKTMLTDHQRAAVATNRAYRATLPPKQ
jgi:mono/diheme cytochrome c family protein/Tfp pilus assembly protein PilF